MESVTRFITLRLKLKVNQAKSAVAQPRQRKFLGFSFTGDIESRSTAITETEFKLTHLGGMVICWRACSTVGSEGEPRFPPEPHNPGKRTRP